MVRRIWAKGLPVARLDARNIANVVAKRFAPLELFRMRTEAYEYVAGNLAWTFPGHIADNPSPDQFGRTLDIVQVFDGCSAFLNHGLAPQKPSRISALHYTSPIE
jgi:hypothetical protein